MNNNNNNKKRADTMDERGAGEGDTRETGTVVVLVGCSPYWSRM